MLARGRDRFELGSLAPESKPLLLWQADSQF